MLPDQSPRSVGDEEATPDMQPLYAMPFAIQLQNTFFIEIVARRSPIATEAPPEVRFNISDIQIDPETFRAQATLNMHIGYPQDPPPFEISFKMLGQFTYTQEYTTEMVHMYLEQASLSIMLPFARELILSLCTRLQVPPIMLAMLRVVPHPATVERKEENTPQ